jgi:MoaA/NifB/PqqE/SkfB family radical SAM enzyme
MFFVEYVPSDGKSSSLAPTDFERAILSEQVDKIREKVRMVILSFPGDEDAVGGCLAAGRGFFHINASGSAEPCPFSPYSDMSLKDNTITEVLASPLFKALRDNKALQGAHDGGCLLWEKREYVSGLVNDSNAV